MTRLLEDMLNEEEYSAIERVHESPNFRFGKLVEIAGLNPSEDFRHAYLRFVDFRGSDLRGYDFEGADLLFCIKDESTQIDETTSFIDAQIEWMDKSEIDIVQRMLQAESAQGSNQRRIILSDLVNNYQSDRHVGMYILRSIRESDDIDELVDFSEFFVGDASPEVLRAFSERFIKLAKRRRAQHSRRKMGPGQISAGRIVDAISESRSEILQALFESLTNLYEKGKLPTPSEHYSPSMSDLIEAAEVLSKESRLV